MQCSLKSCKSLEQCLLVLFNVVLGTCNTCVRLPSRITSSGATVNSWMILFYFIIIGYYYYYRLLFLSLFFCFCLFDLFLAFVGLFVVVCFQVCVVVVIVLACFCFWGQGQGVVIIICWSVN